MIKTELGMINDYNSNNSSAAISRLMGHAGAATHNHHQQLSPNAAAAAAAAISPNAHGQALRDGKLLCWCWLKLTNPLFIHLSLYNNQLSTDAFHFIEE